MKFVHVILAVTASFLVSQSGIAAGANASHPFTPFSAEAALVDAHRLAAKREGSQVVRIEGQSMLPYFGDGSVLVTNQITTAELRPGMVVVYRNRFGEMVAHRVETLAESGWIVRGYNNDASDSTPVTDQNLVGVVYATFYSSGRITEPLAYTDLARDTVLALAAPAR